MSGTFRDFIPAGEDTGALGNGYTDFVPAKTEVKEEVVVEQEVEQEKKPIKKGKK